MNRIKSTAIGYIGALGAASVMALTTGCASGGFKLTRQYAGFVNKQPILLRIIIYILTGIVYAVTMLIDLVIFNTIDFWEGRVSAGGYEFKKDDKTYHVKHEVLPNLLKKSTIEIKDNSGTLLQTVVLSETLSSEIEVHVDGKLRSRVKDIRSAPVATVYDINGKQVEQSEIPLVPTLARR